MFIGKQQDGSYTTPSESHAEMNILFSINRQSHSGLVSQAEYKNVINGKKIR